MSGIPIEDHRWHRVPYEELKLPAGHRAEYAKTGKAEFTARIVGPNAHVLGKDPDLWEAIQKAVLWFESTGSEL